ncbi:MAG: hypothetical protein J6U19_00930 [Oscillospiraceae bacterium]|nr:hypothetical protein [Oscillospiraceae bacterium]
MKSLSNACCVNAVPGSDEESIIIYHYFDLSDPEGYCRALEGRFRQSGHTRPIVFKNWNCYTSEPGRDGDLFFYDAVVMSALVDKGYLNLFPDIFHTGHLFDWVQDRTKVQQQTYGYPFMVCGNTLICRKEDDSGIRNIMDLHEHVAVPMQTMMPYYYLQAFCNSQDPSGGFDIMEHLLGLMGGKDAVEGSTVEAYDGINRFIRGECRYYLGFTEGMRKFPKGDYTVRFANFSENKTDQMPLFFCDMVSIGKHVREEKLLDCLDLLEIVTDEDFIYEICTMNGQLQYMLPANRNLYPRLAKLDPLYQQFFRLLNSDENSPFRYGAAFYEDFDRGAGDMLKNLVGNQEHLFQRAAEFLRSRSMTKGPNGR